MFTMIGGQRDDSTQLDAKNPVSEMLLNMITKINLIARCNRRPMKTGILEVQSLLCRADGGSRTR
jgi:hypothetical protein